VVVNPATQASALDIPQGFESKVVCEHSTGGSNLDVGRHLVVFNDTDGHCVSEVWLLKRDGTREDAAAGLGGDERSFSSCYRHLTECLILSLIEL
jgi:hypothetical protein